MSIPFKKISSKHGNSKCPECEILIKECDCDFNCPACNVQDEYLMDNSIVCVSNDCRVRRFFTQ